jgi:hypothetical protein
MILKEVIDDLKPLRKGGVTFYPAASLERIFDWAQTSARELQWVEGVFYDPDSDDGELSLSYICERREAEYEGFRLTCVRLAREMEAEAAAKGLGAYFEIGISA